MMTCAALLHSNVVRRWVIRLLCTAVHGDGSQKSLVEDCCRSLVVWISSENITSK